MKKYLAIILVLLSVACTDSPAQVESTPTAESIAQTTNTPTPEPTATNTAEPTTTEEPTNTPTSTNTPTPTSTETSTPTNTPSPSATPTDTPTPSPTFPPVTNTPLPPPTPSAPVFPNTPVQPWDQTVFTNSVVTLADSTHQFHDAFGRIANGRTGSCQEVWGYQNNWETLPAFTDIPPERQAQYAEYRYILSGLIQAIAPILDVCANGGGIIPPSTDQIILASIESLRGRAEALESAVLSG